MKLKIHTYISTLFVLLAGCANAMSKNQTAFEWVASESATDLYRLKSCRVFFHYRGSEMGVFIPSGGTYEGEWGEFISTHVGGNDVRELPDRMSILYYSLAENNFTKAPLIYPTIKY